MKYIVVLCDGMADYPCKELDGDTPMRRANKPNMDRLARLGEVGLVKTVADGLKPGSDVANLSVMGYDPALYYTGRSPLEAVSMGINLTPGDLAMRCNLVTLSNEEDYGAKTMVDYSAGDISSKEAAELIAAVQEAFGSELYSFYPGVSYRHCLVQHADQDPGFLTPPHDISGQVIGDYLPKDPAAAALLAMMEKSYALLSKHPVNQKRVAQGKRPANSIWLWGQGKKPQLPSFEEKFGLKGSVVSAVDLIKGIGQCAKMRTPHVEGATGYLDTNFEGKADAALVELTSGQDFVYVHIEAPDECGHRYEVENKVKAIELIDERVLGPILAGLQYCDHYRILILPDHPTPLSTRTHASDPVPFLLYDSKEEKNNGIGCFCEETAAATGVFVEPGHTLMNRFVGR